MRDKRNGPLAELFALSAFVDHACVNPDTLDDEMILEIVGIVDDVHHDESAGNRIEAIVRRCHPGASDDTIEDVASRALDAIRKEVLPF